MLPLIAIVVLTNATVFVDLVLGIILVGVLCGRFLPDESQSTRFSRVQGVKLTCALVMINAPLLMMITLFDLLQPVLVILATYAIITCLLAIVSFRMRDFSKL